jgi:hypothetical protein
VHPSWQKFLANQVNVDLQHGIGCEVIHRMLMIDAKDLVPSKAVVDLISDTFKSWHCLELRRVFNYCHPNKNGTKLFAAEIAQNLNTWINNIYKN